MVWEAIENYFCRLGFDAGLFRKCNLIRRFYEQGVLKSNDGCGSKKAELYSKIPAFCSI